MSTVTLATKHNLPQSLGMKPCCQFGAGFRFRRGADDEPWNEVLFESSNFVALPTRGALVEGWLLIVPREHHYCAGAFSDELLSEFQLFRQEVQQTLESTYGPIVAFEHGPAHSGRPAGCGVDHAHVHLLPWTGAFADAVKRYGNDEFTWERVDGIEALSAIHSSNRDYLYYEEATGEARIAASGAIPSQFFRRIVASAIGQSELYDWKQHSGIQQVRATVEKLRRASAHCGASA